MTLIDVTILFAGNLLDDLNINDPPPADGWDRTLEMDPLSPVSSNEGDHVIDMHFEDDSPAESHDRQTHANPTNTASSSNTRPSSSRGLPYDDQDRPWQSPRSERIRTRSTDSRTTTSSRPRTEELPVSPIFTRPIVYNIRTLLKEIEQGDDHQALNSMASIFHRIIKQFVNCPPNSLPFRRNTSHRQSSSRKQRPQRVPDMRDTERSSHDRRAPNKNWHQTERKPHRNPNPQSSRGTSRHIYYQDEHVARR